MIDETKIPASIRERIAIEQAILNYYNKILREQDLITEREYRLMQTNIIKREKRVKAASMER